MHEYSSARDFRLIGIASAFLLLISILLWLNSATIATIKVPYPLAFHTALETATIVLFVSVFIVCWNAFGERRNRSSLILAVAFLCAAILGFFHALVFQGMPGFENSNSMHQSLSFWLGSRYIVTFTLLGLALKPSDRLVSNLHSSISLAFGLALTIALSLLIFYSPDLLPATYDSQLGQTRFKIVGEVILVIFNLVSAYFFFQQIPSFNGSRLNDLLELNRGYLCFASIMLAISEIYFCLYRYSTEAFVLIGHIFQLLSALAIYRGMVAINIHAPYAFLIKNTSQLQDTADELLVNKQRLAGVIETAMDGILTVDDQFKIILVNPAAARVFGYEVSQLIGQNLDIVIPMRHRHVHTKHVQAFGQHGTTRRQMGTSFEDFYVTGLHADGSEFPIEASISSLIEHGRRFYTVIFRDISERKIAKEKLAQYHNQLSQLSAALQSIREEERKHIARELHDDLGQLLAALRMDLSLLQRDQAMSERSRLTLGSMDQLLLTSITTLRRIATDLRPRALDEGGLFFALQTLQKEFSQRHGVHCDLIADEEQLILDDEKSTAIFRIVQESLTNVARHAKATHVEIYFERDQNHLLLKIKDDGRGIEEGAMNKTRSFGLVGMRERIKAMNGRFDLHSKVGKGTEIEVEVPLSNDENEPNGKTK